MDSKPKIHIDGQYYTYAELLIYAHKRAKELPGDPILRKSYVDNITNLFNHELETDKAMQRHEITKANRKDIIQSIVLPLIGVFGLISMMFVVIYNPLPSKFQSGVYWTVLSLAAAAFAAMIPGFVKFKHQESIKAGGAVAIFLIMYFFVPTIMKEADGKQQQKLHLYVVKSDTISMQAIPIDFNPNSSTTVRDLTQNAIVKYYGSTPILDTFTCYRMSDGMIYLNESCRDMTEYEVLMISNTILGKYKNKRDAYNYFSALKSGN